MIKKNQTEKIHLEFVKQNKDVSGDALFIMKSNSNPKRPYIKKIISNIKYEEAVRRGKELVSFKFIPYGTKINLKGEQINFTLSISNSICNGKWICNGQCDNECHEDVACLCIEGQCY